MLETLKVYFGYLLPMLEFADMRTGMQHVRETVEKAQPDIMVRFSCFH